jgi:predicted secreted protein
VCLAGRASTDTVVQFLVARLAEPPNRLGTLYVLRHICARLGASRPPSPRVSDGRRAADDLLETRRAFVVSGLKQLLADPSVKVQDGLVALAAVLGRLGYLRCACSGVRPVLYVV